MICDELAETLKSDECSVSLVAVIYLRVEAELTESTDTADTEEELLLETVLPVSTLEVICD